MPVSRHSPSEYMKRPHPLPIERSSVTLMVNPVGNDEQTPYGWIKQTGMRLVESESLSNSYEETLEDMKRESIIINGKLSDLKSAMSRPRETLPVIHQSPSKRPVKRNRASLKHLLQPVVSLRNLKSPRDSSLKQIKSTLIQLIDTPEPQYEPPLPTNVIWCSKQIE